MDLTATHLLEIAGKSPLLQGVAIILGTFILEDGATAAAAMSVQGGGVAMPVALVSLYLGIVMGDIGLYGLGRLSATRSWAKRLVGPRRRDIGQEWVKTRVVPLVLVSRFVPGLRLPTYTTLGFLKAPITKFALAAVLATLVWTSGLFFVSVKLGGLLLHYLGVWRWAGLAVFCFILIMAGRYASRLYNKRLNP